MPTAPYDIVESVLQTARVRLNDAIQSIAGEVLTDTAAFTQTAVNSAWRRLQEFLVDMGEVKFTEETIISALPATAGGGDPGSQVWLDWTGYFNSALLSASYPLPQDFISPLFLWERVTGSVTGVYLEMSQIQKGLPTYAKLTTNKIWEWRQERIYMPGATGSTDLRIRYAAYLPDFLTSGLTQWYQQPVPIMRSLSPLAWYICSEVAKARGDLDAGYFDQKAIEASVFIFNRNFAQPKFGDKDSESGKMTDKYTPAAIIPQRGIK